MVILGMNKEMTSILRVKQWRRVTRFEFSHCEEFLEAQEVEALDATQRQQGMESKCLTLCEILCGKNSAR